MNRLTIGLLQIMPCGSREENLKKGMDACRQAKAAGNMHRQMKDAHHEEKRKERSGRPSKNHIEIGTGKDIFQWM